MTPISSDPLLVGYLDARAKVIAAGYGPDIDWAESLSTVHPDATYVMRESAFVVLNSGFRHTVARKLWPGLSEAFLDWDPARIDAACGERGMRVLAHKGKIEAMVRIAAVLRDEGHERIVADAIEPLKLTRLPFVGKITCWHLAKLLGADVVKPDVHLQRASEAAGFPSPLAMCEAVREAQRGKGVEPDRLTVIDSVFWRYGEQRLARGWSTWGWLFGVPFGN